MRWGTSRTRTHWHGVGEFLHRSGVLKWYPEVKIFGRLNDYPWFACLGSKPQKPMTWYLLRDLATATLEWPPDLQNLLGSCEEFSEIIGFTSGKLGTVGVITTNQLGVGTVGRSFLTLKINALFRGKITTVLWSLFCAPCCSHAILQTSHGIQKRKRRLLFFSSFSEEGELTDPKEVGFSQTAASLSFSLVKCFTWQNQRYQASLSLILPRKVMI